MYKFEIENEDEVEDSSTNADQQPYLTASGGILGVSTVGPERNLISILTKEDISFYKASDGYFCDQMTYELPSNDQDGIIQAMERELKNISQIVE